MAPLAHKQNIPVVMDYSLIRFKSLYAAAGHPHCVFASNYDELRRISGAMISNEISIQK